MRSIFVGLLPLFPIALTGTIGFALGHTAPVPAGYETLAVLTFVVLSFIFLFPLLLGLFSLPFHASIKRGRYIRTLTDATYFGRACYGRLWTCLFYSGPLYQIFLGIRPFRNMVLKLFGMKGPLDFTVFPDTWIRDLPVLMIETGAYMANKSTIGTNICLKDNVTLVDGIRLGNQVMVGHMSVIGPGCKIKDNSELGVSVVLGIRATICETVSVGALSAVNHGAYIGQRCTIGTRSYVGVRANIADDVHIPANTVIPDGYKVVSTEDLQRVLNAGRSQVADVIAEVKDIMFRNGTDS